MRPAILILVLFVLVSCNSREKIKIKGALLNSKGKILHFEEVSASRIKSLDSISMKNSGRFSFSVKSKIPQFYQLRSDNKIISLLMEPGEHAAISGDINNLSETLVIEGSKGSALINDLTGKLKKAKSKLDSLTILYDRTDDEDHRKELEAIYKETIEQHRRYSIEFILHHHSSMASLMAIYQEIQPQTYLFNKARDIQFYKIVRDSLKKRFPKSKHVIVLDKYTNSLLQKYHTQRLFSFAKPTDFGLPDIALPDPKGDTIKLASLKGKYIFLSFWASWNEESVNENIKLKDVYSKFRNKGFEIYQVSFDKSVAHWTRAINFDELPWLCVNDSSFPNSIVATNYNVQTLPYNYLIDKDLETIIAKNINSAILNSRLTELLN